eukprot:1392098-Amorphochlora_amoeboformis.AAC.1
MMSAVSSDFFRNSRVLRSRARTDRPPLHASLMFNRLSLSSFNLSLTVISIPLSSCSSKSVLRRACSS